MSAARVEGGRSVSRSSSAASACRRVMVELELPPPNAKEADEMRPSIQLHPEDLDHILAIARYYVEFAHMWADSPDATDDEALEIRGHRTFCREWLAEEADGAFADEDGLTEWERDGWKGQAEAALAARIPADGIEAAAKAICEMPDDGVHPWEHAAETDKEWHREAARRAFVAAGIVDSPADDTEIEGQ